jgi:hypothetical protein
MKKIVTLFIFLILYLFGYAQGGVWTWVKGSDTLNSPGHYGIKGVPDPANCPPGRYQAAQWKDLNGNFWIFGGTDGGGEDYNDLWKYEPTTNIWTWVNGSSIPNGLGVYGTKGIPGPNNVPGARGHGSTTWTDQQGHLWMHAGFGYDQLGTCFCPIDDMWMYDIPTNQWTWMQGATVGLTSANFGTLGTADTGNTPGARSEANTAWVKSDGTLWTYGGNGGDSVGWGNDMWKFDVSNNKWTWMSGDSSGLSWSFGTQGVENSTNLPVASTPYTCWQDANENFYFFFRIAIYTWRSWCFGWRKSIVEI